MTNDPAFGFDGLDGFKTKPKPQYTKQEELERESVDDIANSLGFQPRNNTVERRKRKGVSKPVEQFNLRAHIEDINKFVDYAETNKISYREAFAVLVQSLPSNK